MFRGFGAAARWTALQVRYAPAEAWGLIVVFSGAVAWLGVYASGAGPIGGVIDYTGSLIGGRLVVLTPLVLIAAGVMIVVRRTREHVARIMVGFAICCTALAAMIHLARGDPALDVPIERLQRMGGIVGALVAHPLAGLIGSWFTWIVLVLLFGIGTMVITRTPVVTVVGWIKEGASVSASFMAGLVTGILEGDDDEEDEEEDEEEED
ncbi:MAG: DNA translocase FtsK 4TM domain-containing protein, partial [Actinomycetota bacterium]